MKDEGVLKTPGAKENHQGYNVNYKDPLTQVRIGTTKKKLTAKFFFIISQERMILPTPPLPPWKGRRPVQRSYSSEMLNSDTMLRYNNGGELTSLSLVS